MFNTLLTLLPWPFTPYPWLMTVCPCLSTPSFRYTTWLDDSVHVNEYEILSSASWKLVKKPAGFSSLQKNVDATNMCQGASGYRVIIMAAVTTYPISLSICCLKETSLTIISFNVTGYQRCSQSIWGKELFWYYLQRQKVILYDEKVQGRIGSNLYIPQISALSFL